MASSWNVMMHDFSFILYARKVFDRATDLFAGYSRIFTLEGSMDLLLVVSLQTSKHTSRNYCVLRSFEVGFNF